MLLVYNKWVFAETSLGMCAGPCGGCSELYYDFFPERGAAGADLEDDSRQVLCFPSLFHGMLC